MKEQTHILGSTYEDLEQAIQRVRELANQLDDYDWKTNEASYQLTGHLVAVKILRALDGEQ